MSGVIGNTIEVNVWARSVWSEVNKQWVNNVGVEPVVLPQGIWLVVWNVCNLYEGNWTTPRNPTPPESRPLYFAPEIGLQFPTLPKGVEILDGPKWPDQWNRTQWPVVFRVSTAEAHNFQYDVNVVHEAGEVKEVVLRFDPTILVETDPVST